MKNTKVYRSKIDAWLLILLGVVCLLTFVLPLMAGDWKALFITILPSAFIIHLLSNTYYTICGNTLNVKAGFVVNKTIDISAIKKIEETNNMISSPANSLDRLEITYGKYDSVIISPKNKAEFIADILAINDQIEVKYKA